MWLLTRWLRLVTVYFYSHIPCGMWQEPSWESLDLLEISTHTSRVGCDTVNGADNPEEWGFLLTHPVWDVTPNRTRKRPTMRKISTHTSRVGCDGERKDLFRRGKGFLLTHPVWDVTKSVLHCPFRRKNFYSHIPCGMWRRTEERNWDNQNFYSHIPCGMWPVQYLLFDGLTHFYSHIPCGMWPLYIVYFNHIIPIYYRMDL